MPALRLFLSFHYVRKLMVCSKIINIRIYFFLNKWWYNVIYKQVLLNPDAFVSEVGTEVVDSKSTSHSLRDFYFPLKESLQEVVARQKLLSHKTEYLLGLCSGKGPKGRTKPMWYLVGKAWIKSTITNISESNQGFGGAQLQKHNFQKVCGYHLLKIWPFWAVLKWTVIFCTLFQWIVRSSLLSLKIQAFCHTVPSFCTSSKSPSCQYATAWLVACLYCPEETLSRIQATIDVETQGEATRDRGGLGE